MDGGYKKGGIMAVKTGEQYLEELKETKPNVYMNGDSQLSGIRILLLRPDKNRCHSHPHKLYAEG